MKKLIIFLAIFCVIGISAYAQIQKDSVTRDSNDGGGPFTGNLIFVPDNTYDIGVSGANRPRAVYVADDVFIGGDYLGTDNDSFIRITTNRVAFYANGTRIASAGSGATGFEIDNQDLLWRTDAGGDIGNPTENRPDNIYVSDRIEVPMVVNLRQDLDIADSGDANPATATLNPDNNLVVITCSDAEGCIVTMGEAEILPRDLKLINDSANNVTVNDTSGVTELTGNATLAQYDSLTLEYIGDRWVEISRSNN